MIDSAVKVAMGHMQCVLADDDRFGSIDGGSVLRLGPTYCAYHDVLTVGENKDICPRAVEAVESITNAVLDDADVRSRASVALGSVLLGPVSCFDENGEPAEMAVTATAEEAKTLINALSGSIRNLLR